MARRIGYRQGQPRAQREKTHIRGYGADWRRVRLLALARDKWLCQDCSAKGVIRPADDVHHKVKIVADRSKRLDVDNLLSLCGECHDIRTSSGE